MIDEIDMRRVLEETNNYLDPFAALVCVALVLFTVAAYLRYAWIVWRLERELRRSEGLLEAVNAQGEDGLAELEKALPESSTLKGAWVSFHAGLVPDSLAKSSATPKYISLLPASSVFTSPRLLHATGANIAFFNAIPNLLIGVGLLFTFLGLTIAIYIASHSVGVGVDAAKAGTSAANAAAYSTQVLLKTAAFKFVTSLFGLLCSIGFNIADKRLIHHLDKRVRAFSDKVDRLFPPRSIEAALYIHQQRISILPEVIADTVGSRFALSVAQVREDLSTSLTRIEGQLLANSQSAVKEALAGLQQSVERLLGAHVERVGEQLKMLEEQVRSGAVEVREALNTGARSLRSSATEVADRLARVSQQLEDNARSATMLLAEAAKESNGLATQTQKALSETLGGAQTLLQHLWSASQGIASAHDGIVRSVSSLNTTMADLSASSERLSTAGASIGAAAGQNLAATDNMNKSTQSLSASIASVHELTSSLQGGLENTVKQMSEHLRGLQGVDASLGSVFLKLREGLDAYSKDVERLHHGLTKGVTEIASQLREAGLELKQLREEADRTGAD